MGKGVVIGVSIVTIFLAIIIMAIAYSFMTYNPANNQGLQDSCAILKNQLKQNQFAYDTQSYLLQIRQYDDQCGGITGDFFNK